MPALYEHAPLDSVEALLAPSHLEVLERRHVTSVRRQAIATADGLSGASIERVETDGHGGIRSYVMKRFAHASDWIMRATNDTRGRAAQVWISGIMDQLPDSIEHAVMACARDGDGWALLMRDVQKFLIPSGDTPIALEQQRLFLAHMTAMHARLCDSAERVENDFGFLSLLDRLGEFSPAMAERERDDPHPIPRMVGQGWESLHEVVDNNVVSIVRALHSDPSPLARALAKFPQTIVHGDWKLGNLGQTDDHPEPRTVLLDWQVVGVAPPSVDFAWYLAVNASRLPESREATIAAFTRCSMEALGDRFNTTWWEPHMSLGMLYGFMQLGWPKVLGALHGDVQTQARERAELAWWSERVRAAARLL